MPASKRRLWTTGVLVVLFVTALSLLLMSQSIIPSFLPPDIALGEYAPILIALLIIVATKIWEVL